MKKIYIKLLIIILILSSILFSYSYFQLSGSEIDGISDISSATLITISKNDISNDNGQKYILDSEQVELLKSLILKSDFTRTLSSTFPLNDQDTYVIEINFNNTADFLRIFCFGNERISIPSQFSGKHLKINNKNWESTLKEIIKLNTEKINN